MVYNMNDPMNRSIYLEQFLPTFDGMLAPLNSNVPYPWGAPIVPNMPGLAPQPTQDSWYYSNDGVNDGKISTMEKLKAFAKGGTYNMVRGMFCNKDGFSWGRTLTTAAAATAIALTGPIGAAIAGGIGLICAVDNFRNSNFKAKTAVTDQQAREAYEGYGEAATTAGLSILGGYKGGKAIKNNFAWAKTYNPTVPLKAKLMKWDVSKWYRPLWQPIIEPIEITETPQVTGLIEGPKPVAGYLPAPNQVTPPNPNPNPNPVRPSVTVRPSVDVSIPENVAATYTSGWAPTGNAPKPAQPNFVSDWAPTGNIPKPATPVQPPQPNFVSDWAPTGNAPKPAQPNFVSDWAVGNVPKPQVETVVTDGHFFG